MSTLRQLAERFKAWRSRRYWTPERQLEHLRNLILEDWRWLAHDPVADALTTRYKRALSADWYRMVHEDSGNFRRRIGIEPDYAFKNFNSREHVQSVKERMERGEPSYSDGPLPERGRD